MCGDAAMVEAESIAREAQVEITALSPGLFKLTDTEAAFRHEIAEVYPRAAEWAKRWNLPGLIVFGFHKPGATEPPPRNSPVTTHPRKSASGSVKPPNEPPGQPDPDDRARAHLLVRYRPRHRGPVTRLTQRKNQLGSGNVAWLENRDPIGEFDAVAPYIANVHIKDIRPVHGDPEWVPAGEGIVDYAAQFRALRRIGYTGPVSLEPHMDFSVEATRRCKEAVERLL
jgi:sugar phosphate isomerase/epimerase